MIKRLFKTMVAVLAIAAAAAGPVRGQTSQTSTLNFTAAYGSGPATADDEVEWTVTSDGNESNYDGTKGIHYGTNSAQVGYIQLSTSDIIGTITQVKVNASTASGVNEATVGVTVGGNAFGNAQSLSTDATNYTFTGSATGEIVVRVAKPEAANRALYVKSVVVTYTPASAGGGSGSETPTPGQNANVSWVLTPYGDLQDGDTVVIVDKSTERALPNNASGTPSAVEIELSGDQNALTEVPADTLKWVVVLNNGNYQFRKPGTDNEYLFCLDFSNGVRVGVSSANQFTFQIGGTYDAPFLKNTINSRYIGLNGSYDWNSPTSITGSSTIKNTVTGFYVRPAAVPPVPHTVRFASGNDGWTVTDVDSARSATAPAVLQNVMAGDSLVVTAPGTLPGKVKSVKAVKYVPPVLVSSIVLDKQTANLAKDSTMTLTASVLPENAADKSYTWSSDNTSVATVNQNGVVTGHNGGTANIIATANDGSGVKDTCVVTVLNSAILDGVTVLYASDSWSTVIGYNPGVLYQDDDDNVRLTSNGAFLYHDGTPVYVIENFYPGSNGYQWLLVTNIDGSKFYYRQGETWQQAISAGRMYNEMWSIEGGQVKNMMQTLVDSNMEPVDPTATIDPSTVNYYLWYLDN